MEPRYILDESFAKSEDSEYFNGDIEQYGFCTPIGSNYHIYSGALAALLTADEVQVKIDTRQSKANWETTVEAGITTVRKAGITESGEIKEGVIRGKNFTNDYRTGYDQGKAWFKENYDPAPAILYGPHAKSYFANLHTLVYHTPCGTWPDGVIGWKGRMNFILSSKNIRQIGYYSAIIAEVELLAEKHQALFSDLEECRHNEGNEPERVNKDETFAQNSEQTRQKKVNQSDETFADYIKEEYREKLLPYLTLLLTGKQPRHFGMMLFALSDLEIMHPKVFSAIQVKLHDALTQTFNNVGKVGTRPRLTQLIKELDTASTTQQKQIAKYKLLIKKCLDS